MNRPQMVPSSVDAVLNLIFLKQRGKYGAQNAGNIGQLPCISAKVSPAAPRFRLQRATLPPSAAHLPAAAWLGAVVAGGATNSCDGSVHGYTCASGLQWSLTAPPGPASVPRAQFAHIFLFATRSVRA